MNVFYRNFIYMVPLSIRSNTTHKSLPSLALLSSPTAPVHLWIDRPMHARHVFVSVFLFLLALCLVALLPPTGLPPSPRSFFQPWLPPVSSRSGTEHGSAGTECDYSDGRWVRDDAGVTAYTEGCPFLDPGFRCLRNGRRDDSFRYWRWRPHRCHLPK